MVKAVILYKIESLRFHNSLLTSSLESIPTELLLVSPIKNAGTFGKQFRHILDIRKCYLDALKKGILDFYRIDIDHSLENNKQGLLEVSRRVVEEICAEVSLCDNKRLEEKWVDCTPSLKYLGENNRKINPLQAIGLLIEHEVFHEGELALYFKSANLEFPKNWMTYGLI
ncbi:MAG: DinB family protein [Candidatus Thermoplasmatota archaeon]|nr:DinB family protein [Candidatus Thermoplasmatota archaeon]